MAAVIAALVAFTAVLNVLALGRFDNIFEQFFGKADDHIVGETLDADVDYVKSDFNDVASLYEYEEGLVAEIAQNGITLLENDNLLPLEKGTTLSLFSHSSVDLVSGGSGSGSGSFELTKDLKEGLENAGLKVNGTLWNFYKNGAGSSYKRGAGVINYGQSLDWSINECPLSTITADKSVTASYGNSVAMFVFSRAGGEGGDEARDMAAYGGKSGSHYLEPDETELEIIDYLNRMFDDVILLVNCNNAAELGWVKDYPNIKAVVSFPGAGRTGTYGLGYMLTGTDADGNEISPAGHLVDTFAYDAFSSPAMQNMGDYNYTGTDYYYVNYAEGIYVGYKYYETRYEDYVTGRANVGSYDYASTVQYPFGYGLSYTQFEWSDLRVSAPDENGDIDVTVNVRNSGGRAGRDAVQIYVQSPYTQYDADNGVEKAAVSLVGFDVVSLGKGEDEDVTVTVNLGNFTSYDDKNAKTYILEAGTYYITAAQDAHAAVNNILEARAEGGDNSVDAEKMTGVGDADMAGIYVNAADVLYDRSLAGEQITNAFAGTTIADAVYLSRSDWSAMDNGGLRYGSASDTASGAEIGGRQWQHEASAGLKAALDSQTSLNPDEGTVSGTYTFGADNGVELIDLRGAEYDDGLWDKLLDEITLPELAKLVAESGYCTPAIDSISKHKITDLDGPAGLNKVVGHGSAEMGKGYYAMTWPTEYMIACTWDADYALAMGEGVGEDGLYSGVTGWYGPALNIHRTPFAGRNFEYYSEDSYISGAMGRQAVQGAACKGMYGFVKHFALNDQETHRDHLGLVTWADEQTIREIYLKPFEMCMTDNTVSVKYNEAVKDADGEITGYAAKTAEVPAMTALMTSFNRIGTTWAGGNYDLLTRILRNEWGFNGFVITDYEVTNYMFTRQSLAAGGDAKLTTVDWGGFSLDGDVEYQAYAREAAHHILYAVVNSAAMNGFVHGVRMVSGIAYYKIILIVWDCVAGIATAGMIFAVIRNALKLKRQNKQ